MSLDVSRHLSFYFFIWHGGGGGGYSQKNWVGVCGPLPKTLTLFMTKICDFPYPTYNLTKNLIPIYDLTLKSPGGVLRYISDGDV